MKTMVKLFALLVVVIVIVVGGAIYYLDGIAATAIEKGASYALGVPTSVDSVRIRLATGSFGVHGLDVANPSGFAQPRFMGLRSARLELPLRRLLADTVTISAIELDGIEINLERSGGGSNYGVILDNLKRLESGAADSAKQEPAEATQDASKQFIIETLAIRDVKANVTMGLGGVGKPSITVTVPEILLRDVGSKEGGVDLGEVASIVTKAVLDAVTKAGALPLDVARDLAGNLKGLAGVAIELPPGMGDAAKGLLDAGKATGAKGFGEGAGEVEKALKGLGGLLGGKK